MQIFHHGPIYTDAFTSEAKPLTVATNAVFGVQVCNHIAVDVLYSSSVCLSATPVNCVQTADPMAMKFRELVCIDPGHIVPVRARQVHRTFTYVIVRDREQPVGLYMCISK